MDEALGSVCGDGQEGIDCPFCQDKVSLEFIERMKAAALAKPIKSMTFDEAMTWMRASDDRIA